MKLIPLYAFKTHVGTFYISQSEEGFHPVFDNYILGKYAHPCLAAEDLAGGCTESIHAGGKLVKPGALGIPAALEDWEPLRIYGDSKPL
jgi:hypothetical protein